MAHYRKIAPPGELTRRGPGFLSPAGGKFIPPPTPGAPTTPGTPFEATPFEAPTFEAPEWDESKITQLSRAAAAPGVRQLRRGVQQALPGGYSPQEIQARRAAVEGYGGALSQVMGGARATGRAQYGEQYGREFRAAELGFGGELEEARADWQAGQAGLEREWRTGEAEAGREWQTGEAEAQREWQEEQVELGREWETGETETGREWQEEFGGPTGTGLPGSDEIGPPPAGYREGSQPGVYYSPTGRRWRGPGRATGGRVVPTYKVGERGPELVAYDSGRAELVGQGGPEIRTFPEEGEVIPAGKTRAIMSRQAGGPVQSPMQPPPLSEEEQVAFDRAMQEYRKTYPQDFGVVPENRQPINRKRGGRVGRTRGQTQNPSSREAWMNQPYTVGLLDPMYDLTKHLIGHPRWYVDMLMERGWAIAMKRV